MFTSTSTHGRQIITNHDGGLFKFAYILYFPVSKSSVNAMSQETAQNVGFQLDHSFGRFNSGVVVKIQK
jgi:hypothetical protein